MDYFGRMKKRLSGQEAYVPAHLGDKKLLRTFAANLGVRTPKVTFFGPSAGVGENEFPDEFVLKPAFASTSIGVLLLAKNGEDGFLNLLSGDDLSSDDLVAHCREISERFFGDGSKGNFIVEELLRAVDGTTPPQDIRFYSFQGEIGLILKEDHLTGSAARAMYFDGNFLPFADLDRRYGVAPGAEELEEIVEAQVPENWPELLAVARRVSVSVPTAFCRVDLYNAQVGVCLGEITFFPGTFYYADRKIMKPAEAERLGRLWGDAEARLAGSLSANARKPDRSDLGVPPPKE